MDNTDSTLLQILSKNADVTASELTSAVNLSIPAINKRIAKLKASGVIRRTTILTDAGQVGKPIIAFVLVVLDRFADTDGLLQYVQADPDVLECYAVTGEYDYLLKICAADIEAFERKLLQLKRSRSVSKSHTLLALQENKFFPVPLPGSTMDSNTTMKRQERIHR